MASNQFKLNASKTHLMTVGTRERLRTLDSKVDVTMDGVQLVESKEASELLLGCELQSDLKLHTQIEKLVDKLKKSQESQVCPPFQDKKSDQLRLSPTLLQGQEGWPCTPD